MVELMITMVIIALISAIALPFYESFTQRNQTAIAVSDMMSIQMEIDRFDAENFALPDTLTQIGMNGLLDPWGAPYEYLRLAGNNSPGINGQRRRDRNLNPVNSDYDLYSNGADGNSQAQFTANKARDDIVRASDGGFYGLAQDY